MAKTKQPPIGFGRTPMPDAAGHEPDRDAPAPTDLGAALALRTRGARP